MRAVLAINKLRIDAHHFLDEVDKVAFNGARKRATALPYQC
jgi:hypothetical protein